MRMQFLNTMTTYSFFTLLALSVILLSSCADEEEGDGLIYGGSWTSGWPELGHDGERVESSRIIVFSNYATMETKEFVSERAEVALDFLLDSWQVSWDDFDFLSTYPKKKIHVFADHDQGVNGGLAYRDGIIIRSPGSPRYIQFGWTTQQWEHTLRHELSHVMEFLLIGTPGFQQANTVWLREGGANYGAGKHDVQLLSELLDWKEQMKDVPGEGNPIKIEVWQDFPQSVINSNTTINYYRFFELSTRYLCDPEGNGTSISNLKQHYEDLGAGKRLENSFEDNFGILLQDFEDNWWDLMEVYLSE